MVPVREFCNRSSHIERPRALRTSAIHLALPQMLMKLFSKGIWMITNMGFCDDLDRMCYKCSALNYVMKPPAKTFPTLPNSECGYLATAIVSFRTSQPGQAT
ncbi:hypothetical protein WG66_011856 [Moniliophthora roreri]|nr:hypothetical protein WG66_011856 [Moniliophthora roreri]